jgi:hypothetical protein
MLARGREKIHKFMGGGAEVADAAVRGERSNVQQNARSSLKFHALIIAAQGAGSSDAKAKASQRMPKRYRNPFCGEEIFNPSGVLGARRNRLREKAGCMAESYEKHPSGSKVPLIRLPLWHGSSRSFSKLSLFLQAVSD